jgi:hypothetical protein
MSLLDRSQWLFLLGGHDLEMETIAHLLGEHVAAEQIVDRQLSWGAKASDYAAEITAAARAGATPVLIELETDIPLPDNAILIDHHNEGSGAERPTSLEQVFRLSPSTNAARNA